MKKKRHITLKHQIIDYFICHHIKNENINKEKNSGNSTLENEIRHIKEKTYHVKYAQDTCPSALGHTE